MGMRKGYATYHVSSVAVHGEGALDELSSSITLAVMTFTAQLYHLLPLTDHEGCTAPPAGPCGASLHCASTHGAGGANGGTEVHQNLELAFQSCSLRRCFCTGDKPCLESQIFLCFCFDCIKEKSL